VLPCVCYWICLYFPFQYLMLPALGLEVIDAAGDSRGDWCQLASHVARDVSMIMRVLGVGAVMLQRSGCDGRVIDSGQGCSRRKAGGGGFGGEACPAMARTGLARPLVGRHG